MIKIDICNSTIIAVAWMIVIAIACTVFPVPVCNHRPGCKLIQVRMSADIML